MINRMTEGQRKMNGVEVWTVDEVLNTHEGLIKVRRTLPNGKEATMRLFCSFANETVPGKTHLDVLPVLNGSVVGYKVCGETDPKFIG